MKPRARTTDLLVESVADEVLVFDLRGDRCHVLNPTAAAVWRACDGRTGPAGLAAAAAAVSGLPAREEIAILALERLQAVGLLEGPAPAKPALSRRALIRRLGLVAGLAGLLPTVQSIVAPPPAAAQSGPSTSPPGGSMSLSPTTISPTSTTSLPTTGS